MEGQSQVFGRKVCYLICYLETISSMVKFNLLKTNPILCFLQNQAKFYLSWVYMASTKASNNMFTLFFLVVLTNPQGSKYKHWMKVCKIFELWVLWVVEQIEVFVCIVFHWLPFFLVFPVVCLPKSTSKKIWKCWGLWHLPQFFCCFWQYITSRWKHLMNICGLRVVGFVDH